MSEQHIHIGGNALGNAIGDHNYVTNTNSFQHCADPIAAARELETLKRQLAELLQKLPPEKVAEATVWAKKLENSATTNDPDNRTWYSLSAKGILEASKWVKDLSVNLAPTLQNLGNAIWVGYTLL